MPPEAIPRNVVKSPGPKGSHGIRKGVVKFALAQWLYKTVSYILGNCRVMKKILSLLLATLIAVQPVLVQARAAQYRHFIPEFPVVSEDEQAPEEYPGENPEVPSTLVLEPESLDFGDVALNGYKKLGVTVRNGGAQRVRLYGSDSVGSSFYANSSACPEYLEAGQSCVADILFSPQRRQKFKGEFNIWAEGQRRVTALLTGTGVPSPLTVNPAVVDFGTVRKGDIVERTVTMTYKGLLAFPYTAQSKVRGVSVIADSCRGALSPSSSCQVTLRLNTQEPDYPLGPVAGQVAFEGGSDGWILPVQANVVDWVPQLSSTHVLFDKVLVGASTVKKAVALLNDGNIPVEFKSFALTADTQWGAAHNCPSLLGPGQSCSVEFSYTPKTQGESDALVTVALGDTQKNVTLQISAAAEAELPTMNFTGSGGNSQLGLRTQDLTGLFWERDLLVATLTNNTAVPTQDLSAVYEGTPAATVKNQCPRQLQPGDSCQVYVRLAAVPGCFSHKLKLVGAAPQVVDIPLEYCIPYPALESSSSSVSFDALHIGSAETATRSVLMTNTGYFPLTVASVTYSGTEDAFTAQHNCANVQPGEHCTVNITFTAQELDNTGVLTLGYSGGSTSVNLYGPGLGQRLKISQNSVDFGTIAPGTHVQVVQLSNVGSLPVALNQLELSAPEVFSLNHNCPSVLDIRQSCSATFTLNASALQAHEGALRVRSSAFDVDVPIRAVVSAAFLSTSTPLLDFGSDTRLGTTKTLSFLVLNDGLSSEPLRVGSVPLSGSNAFTATHNCQYVAPGQSCTVNVTFSPVGPAQEAGTITITPSRGLPVSVVLRGIGQFPALSVSPNGDMGLFFANAPVTRVFTVTNTGNVALPLTSRTVNLGTITSDSCNVTLNSGSSCSFTWSYTPAQTGRQSLMVSLVSSLTTKTFSWGFEVVNASVNVTSPINFGLKGLNEVGVVRVSVYNPHSVPMPVTATLPSSPFFMESSLTTCVGGTGSSYTLSAKSSCDLGFRFNGSSSPGTFNATYRMTLPGGVVQQIALTAQAAARAYYISSSAGSNGTPNGTAHAITVLPPELGTQDVSHTYSTVYLRNQLSNTVNSIQVSVEGHPGFRLQSVQTVNSSNSVGSTIALSGDGRQSVTFNNTLTHPHVRVILAYTGRQEPRVDEAVLVWTVDGVDRYELPYSFSGRYEPALLIGSTLTSTTPVSQYNFGSLPMTSLNTAPLSTVELTLRSTDMAWGSVRGTFVLEGDPDFGFYLQERYVSGGPGAVVGTANPLSRQSQTVTFGDCRTANPSMSVCGYRMTIGLQPTSPGPKNARITFVPEAFTGLQPLSVELTAQAVYAPVLQWSSVSSTQVTPSQNNIVLQHPGVLTGTALQYGASVFLRNTGVGVAPGTIVLDGHPAFEFSSISPTSSSGGTTNTKYYSQGSGVRAHTVDSSWPLSYNSATVQWRIYGPNQAGSYRSTLRFQPAPNSGLAEPTPVSLGVTLLGLSGSPKFTQSNLTTVQTDLNFGLVSLNSYGGLTNQTSSTYYAYLVGSGPLNCSQGHFEIQGPKRDLFRIVELSSSNYSISGSNIINGGLATKKITSCQDGDSLSSMSHFRVTLRYIPTEISSSDTAQLVFIPSAEAVAAGQNPAPVTLQLVGSAQYDVQGVLSGSYNTVTPVTSPADFGALSFNASELGGASYRVQKFYILAQGTAGRLTGRFSLEGSPAFSIVSIRDADSSGAEGSSFSASELAAAPTDVRNSNSSANKNLAISIRFQPTAVGEHIARVTFTPGDTRRAPITWEIRGKGKNDVAFSVSASSTDVAWNSDAGVRSYNGLVGSSVNSSFNLPALYIRNTGTYGRLAGTVSITGPDANAWEFSSIRYADASGNSTGNCSLLSLQTSQLCISGDAAQSSYKHLMVSLRFVPRKLGGHNATLVFTPHGSLGQQPISIPLQGTGVYNAVGTLSNALLNTDTTPAVFEGYYNPRVRLPQAEIRKQNAFM